MTRPILLTGGGTGGHVVPLRAIAEALVAAGVPTDELVIVGSRRGQDAALLADVAVEQVLLPGRGLRRSASPRAILHNVAAAAGLALALLRGVALVVRRRPRAVVSVGGYAAFAASVGAVVGGRPLVLVDLDATPGLVHRTLSTFAVAITSALPVHGEPRAIVTGVPLRAEIADVARTTANRAAARARLGLAEHGDVVAVMSGSLGAASVNRAVGELASRWVDRPTATLYHVTGRRDFDDVEAARARAGIGSDRWQLVAFESAMADLWTACDAAVCRAGAATISELCATGVPSVLVALPGAPGGHQDENARVLERAGAAVVLDDAELTGEALDTTLSAMLADDERLTSMSLAARSLARPDAAARVADVVLRHAR